MTSTPRGRTDARATALAAKRVQCAVEGHPWHAPTGPHGGHQVFRQRCARCDKQRYPTERERREFDGA